ncbi:hypothetical protein EBQ26_07360 [Allofranklinella schreckenbergeri]|nr:hypothetical protein EBQ26_07360 [Allofranklinella schreckenbergeri]
MHAAAPKRLRIAPANPAQRRAKSPFLPIKAPGILGLKNKCPSGQRAAETSGTAGERPRRAYAFRCPADA